MSTLTVTAVDLELTRLIALRKQEQPAEFLRALTRRIDLCLDTRIRLARQER